MGRFPFSVLSYGILMNFFTQRILTPLQPPAPDPPNDTPEPFHNLKSLVITGDRNKQKKQTAKKKQSQTKNALFFFENPNLLNILRTHGFRP